MKTSCFAVNFVRLVLLFGFCSASMASDKLPEKSHDGLELQHGTEMFAVYARPGADLGEYDKIALLDAYVAFKKDWQREHNRNVMRPADRITDAEMNKIRQRLAEEFKEVFIKVLVEEGGHQLAEQGTSGTLVIRPAIINLDVTAPDQQTAGRDYTFAASAGSMTLYMELFDGRTGEIIYRVIDPEAALDRGQFQWANAVTNRAEADRILRKWAELLNSRLKSVKGGN
jgi:hypothetical protein